MEPWMPVISALGGVLVGGLVNGWVQSRIERRRHTDALVLEDRRHTTAVDLEDRRHGFALRQTAREHTIDRALDSYVLLEAERRRILNLNHGNALGNFDGDNEQLSEMISTYMDSLQQALAGFETALESAEIFGSEEVVVAGSRVSRAAAQLYSDAVDVRLSAVVQLRHDLHVTRWRYRAAVKELRARLWALHNAMRREVHAHRQGMNGGPVLE